MPVMPEPSAEHHLLHLTPGQAQLFADPTRADIIALISQRPASIKELAGALDRPKGSIGHHIRRLADAGLIEVVETRQVRAITEKFYGRTARTFVFPDLDEAGERTFLDEAAAEMRDPGDDETALLTLRRARIPLSRAKEFSERLLDLAEEFSTADPGGTTTYGMVLGIYPTDRPSLPDIE